MSSNPVQTLQQIDILKELSDEDLTALFNKMNIGHYQANKVLFHEGDKGDSMFVILSGSVSISVETATGENLELAVIPHGSFFGEMSIFDQFPRSATCTTIEETSVLNLKGEDFYQYIKEYPAAGMAVMHRMLNTVTERLQNTGAFLSEIVTWGEKARTRAVTDDFTGLYNRRFLDQALEERVDEALEKNLPLSLLMIDLDHFGFINKECGEKAADQLILLAVSIFKNIFRDKDILARYGGDEFTFILPDTSGEEALSLSNRMVESFREIEPVSTKDGSTLNVTISAGIAVCPLHAQGVKELKEKADRALYKTKEKGRDGVTLWSDINENRGKRGFQSIYHRNQVIERILLLLEQKDHILLAGHHQPDEDCISSMIALALLIRHLRKQVYLLIPRKLNPKFQYMINISRYNSIEIIYNDHSLPDDISALFVLDTPKPEMMEKFLGRKKILNDTNIPVVEIDHHLESDSGYIGDPQYRLVDEMPSCSMLVGVLAYKLSLKKEWLLKYQIIDLFNRNFVLSVLTGIIGDTQMGKFLKSPREQRFYQLFSRIMNQMLLEKTYNGSGNFSSMEELFKELKHLSDEEDSCYQHMQRHRWESRSGVESVIIPEDAMSEIEEKFDQDTIATVARFLADVLAEINGRIGIVAYVEKKEDSFLLQYRVRRSHSFKELDLRRILDVMQIENGGGHPGAIGFRLDIKEVQSFKDYSQKLLETIQSLLRD